LVSALAKIVLQEGEMARYQVPRGTRDFLPEEMAVRNHVEKMVRAAFESYGFQQIQTPTFEQYELLAARSGEEIKESMFTFASDAGRYALRPELTSPVCRLVASDALQGLARPYKLYYLGPCFRYCRPQPGRYREFYQAGVELMGTSDSLADAEVIAVAVRTLRNLGVCPFRLRIGGVGVFRRLLQDDLPQDERQQERQHHIIYDIDRGLNLREKCEVMVRQPRLGPEDRSLIEGVTNSLAKLQEEIGYKDPATAVTKEPGRSEDELRTRLATLPDVAEATYRAAWVHNGFLPAERANLVVSVARLRGPFAEVLPKARELLAGHAALEPLNDLAAVCGWLPALDVAEFEVALGTARNLDFYTGTVFEIDTPLAGVHRQLCGGGRYDRLVEEFDGPPTPATGFAFGFDRLVEAFKASGRQVGGHAVDVLVMSPPGQRRQAVELAERLRDAGLRTGVDLRPGSDLRQQELYFGQLNAEFAVTLGADGVAADRCRLRARSGATESTPALTDLARTIQSLMAR
jgi:histidyl-tRNA synthetase